MKYIILALLFVFFPSKTKADWRDYKQVPVYTQDAYGNTWMIGTHWIPVRPSKTPFHPGFSRPQYQFIPENYLWRPKYNWINHYSRPVIYWRY